MMPNILNIVGMEDNDDESNSSETKRCRTCKEELPITDFYSQTKQLKTKVKTYTFDDCKKCLSKYNNSPEGKDEYFKRKYNNFSFDKYLRMNESQNYTCWICGCDVTDDRNKKHRKNADPYFSVDHNHRTLKVRGLLCSSCNFGLGMFDDNKEWLQKAIEYLEMDDEDFIVFTEPTELVDGTVEFLGTDGEKFYALLVKLAERENMTVDDYFWDMIKRGVESSKTDPNFNSRLKLDKKITMDEIMENLEE